MALKTLDTTNLRKRYLEFVTSEIHSPPFFTDFASKLDNLSVNKEWLELYVPLLTSSPDKKQVSTKDLRPIRENPLLSAMQIYLQEPYLILCGCEGAGKSTFLHAITLSLAGDLQNIPGMGLSQLIKAEQLIGGEKENSKNHQPLLPLRIDFRDISVHAAQEKTTDKSLLLLNYIDNYFIEIDLEGFIQELHKELEEVGVQFLIDGMDEADAKDNDLYHRFINEFPKFIDLYPKCRMVIAASGDKTYWEQNENFSGFTAAEISPLNKNQINHFIHRWFEYSRKNTDDDEEIPLTLRNKIKKWSDDDINHFHLIQNPLLLTLIIYINIFEGEFFPNTREELFDKAVEALIHQSDFSNMNTLVQKTTPIQKSDRTSFPMELSEVPQELGRIVYEKINRDHCITGLQEFAFSDIISDLSNQDHNYIPGDDLSDKKFKISGGILVSKKPGEYVFPHKLIQDYLLVCYLLEIEYPDNLIALFNSDPKQWQDVLLLAAERLIRKEPNRIWELIDTLYKQSSKTYAGVWVGYAASKILTRIDYSNKEGGLNVIQKAQKSLVRVLECNNLPIKDRACAGILLDKLGDPRFRDDAWFLPNSPFLGFIEIPEGKFIMGTRKEEVPQLIEDLGTGSDWEGQTLGGMLSKEPNIDKLLHEMDLGTGWENLDSTIIMHQWYKREIPQHELWLPTFYILRYPVTIAQFRSFTENNGYEPEIAEGLDGVSNHPLAHVTWSDSLRYCQWLTRTLLTWTGTPQLFKSLLEDGWKVTLPSEAEWEKAARGPANITGEVRIFPWGDEFNPNFANLKETGLSDTSTVGCFPEGISPYGVLDMTGNVWEWTRSLWGEDEYIVRYQYPYNPYDGRENIVPGELNQLRVLRGASYNNYRRYARCTTRRSPLPVLRTSIRGFRIALSNFGL